MKKNCRFVRISDLLNRKLRVKNARVKELYRAELSMLSSLVEEKLAEIDAEERMALERKIAEAYEELRTALPAPLKARTHPVVVPYGMEIRYGYRDYRYESPAVLVSLVPRFSEEGVYLQPVGLHELRVERKLPTSMDEYYIRLYFKDPMHPRPGSIGISHRELEDLDKHRVENFVKSLVTYLNHIYEPRRSESGEKEDAEVRKKEITELYSDPVLLYSWVRDYPVGILVPHGFVDALSRNEMFAPPDEGLAIEIDKESLKSILILLRMETVEKVMIEKDWRWEPWYWYARMRERVILTD